MDYIYQLPVEQRLNGSYLLSVEREKAKLCLEMSNIRNDQKMLKEKISKLNHDEEILKETAKELKAQSITLPAPIESGKLRAKIPNSKTKFSKRIFPQTNFLITL